MVLDSDHNHCKTADAKWLVITLIHADRSRKHGNLRIFREISDQQILWTSDHHGPLHSVIMVVAGVHIAVSEPLVKKARFSIWFRTWGHGV